MLGVLLYEMCALERPFKEGNGRTLQQQIAEAEPEPLPNTFSPAMKDCIARLLQKEPRERLSLPEAILRLEKMSSTRSKVQTKYDPQRG